MTKQQLIDFEDKVKEIYLQGKIKAPIHLSANNEDQLIFIFDKYINKEDYVFTTWRSHHHINLKGVPQEQTMKDILDGKSITLFNKEHKIISSAIVCGILPIAVGTAMGIKRNKGTNKVYCFIGDMASESGIFYESVKYAIRNDLPIQFIIEDNGLSTNSLTQECWGNEVLDNELPINVCSPKKDSVLLDNNNVEVYELPNYNKKVWYYKYERTTQHSGAGKFVNFILLMSLMLNFIV